MPVPVYADAEFQIPMRGKYVALIRKGIRSLAAEAGFDQRDCEDIEVAVGEAVTNAVSYGRPEAGAGRVRARCRLGPNCLIVEVEDEGRTSCLPIPKPVPGSHNEHGRGWMLIHRLMDRVAIRCTERGLLIRMVKHRSGASAVAGHSLNSLPVVA